MLDAMMTHNIETEAADWHQTIALGDIVSYRFPHAEGDKGYRPKARPCLVMNVAEIDGVKVVTLAFGTSANTDANRGFEVRVTRSAVIDAIGLDRATRFVGARRTTVQITDTGFCAGDRGTPVIARLNGAELVRLNDVRVSIFAQADMTEETHAHHRRRPPTAATNPRRIPSRVLVVERRRPKGLWHGRE